jgi:hypothetical protein
MTQRKFKPTTRGGYWVRGVEVIESDSVYVLQAQVGNHSSQPLSKDLLDWHWETFTSDGTYRILHTSSFDLIEEIQ